nr:hypothetical protein GCM10020093_081760 [Planobispora longispora]
MQQIEGQGGEGDRDRVVPPHDQRDGAGGGDRDREAPVGVARGEQRPDRRHLGHAHQDGQRAVEHRGASEGLPGSAPGSADAREAHGSTVRHVAIGVDVS